MVQTVLIHDKVDANADKMMQNLRLGLTREKQISLRDVTDASGKIYDSTDRLIEYLTVLNGVLVICLPTIRKILSGKVEKEESVEISVSGKRTMINAHRLHEKITQSSELAKKIIIVKLPGLSTELPENFPDTQVIDLPDEFKDCQDKSIKTIYDYWAKHCILGRLVALKKRNMFISADSVEN